MDWPWHPNFIQITVPLLFGYVVGSVDALRAWMAVQVLPPAVSCHDAENTSPKTVASMRILKNITNNSYALFVILFLAQIWTWISTGGRSEPVGLLPNITTGIFVCAYYMLHTKAFMSWFGPPQAYYRTAQGATTSTALVVGALYHENDWCASTMLFVALSAVQGQGNEGTVTFRKVAFDLIKWMCPAALTVIGLYVLPNNGSQLNEWPQRSLSQWAFALVMAIPLCGLFGFALRFDFAGHVATAKNTTPIIKLNSAPAHASGIPGQLTSGAVVPSYRDLAATIPFPVLQIWVSIFMWFWVDVIAYPLGPIGYSPSFERLTYGWPCLLLLIYSPLVIGVFAFLDTSEPPPRLWSYEELWTYESASHTAAGVAEAEGDKQKFVILKGAHD
ncbi:hypothetical protein HWV62_25254 [Athelia sp. TMB]|nr:hypothetical protein HWV62_25254 [Athelia sp. TMB]